MKRRAVSSYGSQVSRTTVIVTVRVPGFHAWPNAPGAVRYLAHRHRHLFTVRAEFDVVNCDREVEFHIAQGWVRDAVDTLAPKTDFKAMSCESIAIALHMVMADKRRRTSAIEVWEDDENGSRVEFAK
jgi:hypothetical protein